MAATKKQFDANKKNAQKSTGPATQDGKTKVSENAVKHGILSKKLIISGESAEDYQQLFDSLVSDCGVTSTLGLVVIEKIAINLWRQKRLIQAETAELNLRNRPDWIAEKVNSQLGQRFPRVTADEINGLDQEYLDWCDKATREIEQIEAQNITSWLRLKPVAPIILQSLREAAEEEDLSIKDFLAENGETLEAFIYLFKAKFTRKNRRNDVQELAKLVRQQNSVLNEKTAQQFARYQAALNNEFHKLFNTLVEIKKMEPQFIEGEVITINEENNSAAAASI